MKPGRLLARLGPRLLLSYILASLAAAVSGVAAAFFVPAQTYHPLMLEIMHPPPGASAHRMDALLATAIAQAVTVHVALSLAVAIGVSILAAAYVSREIAGALGRLMRATRRLATGRFAERLHPESIYEIAQLVHDVNSLAQALEVAQQRRNLAIAGVGHELRTPVTALRAYCDALGEGVMDFTPQVLERISRSVDRLEGMAADLSALARAEAGAHQELALAPLPVSEALAAAYDSLRPAYEAAGVELRLETAGTADLTARADAVRLGEILENLLANSLAHTPSGKRVVLGARACGPEVELFVRDEGKGIRPEDLAHVTEPFYRGEGGSAGRTPRAGMGLGLAIADRLARAMQGRIVLQSAGRDLGTTASVYLPHALRHS